MGYWETGESVLRKTLRAIGWIVLSPLVLCLGAGCSGRPVAQGPNIIVPLVDTMRAYHLGCYGYGRNTSPEMDKLAREGVLFNKAYSPSSWTLPSTASLVTSPDGIELYDIAGDPHELNDLAGSKPELAATLSAKQDEFYKQLKRGKSPVVELDEEARRKLRSLGYVARGKCSAYTQG